MSHECGNFLHLGVLPDIDLVEGVSMGADQLVYGLSEDEVADLRTCID